MEQTKSKFKAIESFAINRRKEFYIIGELLDGSVQKDWFVHIPFNPSFSMTVRIKEIEEVQITGEEKPYTLLITSTEIDGSMDLLMELNIGNETLYISPEG